jgi:adenosine deaminase
MSRDQRLIPLSSSFFPLFKIIYKLTDSPKAVQRAVELTLEEFWDDGCYYLELRSTPRANVDTGMTQDAYIEAILRGIASIKERIPRMIVKLILSMDRRMTLEECTQIVDLAQKYAHRGVVGLDICGDPQVGTLSHIVSVVKMVKERTPSVKLTVHLGEIQEDGKEEENEAVLSLHPDRIGHGTFLNHASKPHLSTKGIPLEICMTSNVFCKTVSSYADHHFKGYQVDEHPCILCTDDKGIFQCSLSGEYAIAAKTFGMSFDELFELSRRSIAHIFAEEETKEVLYKEWEAWKSSRAEGARDQKRI